MSKSELLFRSIIGFALGDAYGLPFELEAKYHATMNNMQQDMLGYGSHCQPPGTWSDDTSLMIATMDTMSTWDTLINLEKGEYSEEVLHYIMFAFVQWRNDGKYGCHGECFDVGFTTDCAIKDYIKHQSLKTCGQKEDFNCGNGSLMRILPLAFIINGLPVKRRYDWCEAFSSLTHAHPLATLCSFIYVELLINIIKLRDIECAMQETIATVKEIESYDILSSLYLGKCRRILNNELVKLDVSSITNTGYVVDTLEAVIWCLNHADDFQSAIHLAATLGNDTDTTAALVGGIAAIVYNEPFPREWMEHLKNTDILISITGKFIQSFPRQFDLKY
jgi:ADP-ribosyl-[dinitrogen reductase] hydrolase